MVTLRDSPELRRLQVEMDKIEAAYKIDLTEGYIDTLRQSSDASEWRIRFLQWLYNIRDSLKGLELYVCDVPTGEDE